MFDFFPTIKLPEFQPMWSYTTYPIYPIYTPYTPRFEVPNKKVAVEPFPVVEKKAEVRGGVLAPMNQSALTGLKVVFGSPAFVEGTTVYVRTKLQTGSTYAREIFEVEGRKFILVPEEEIVLLDRGVPPEVK